MKLFHRFKTRRLAKPLSHLEIVEPSEHATEAEVVEYFRNRGIELVPREATLGDLLAGLDPDAKAEAVKQFNNLKPDDWQIPEGYQWMRSPDGILCTVPDNEVETCLAKGWKK